MEWPSLGIEVRVSLLDNEEPEVCEIFWNRLEHPVKTICRHTLSTGCAYNILPRPPVHPIQMGTQAQPLGRKRQMYSQLEPGNILYSGNISVIYGPCTEPLHTSGARVGMVRAQDLENFKRAGKMVWLAQYKSHTPTTVTVRRLA